MDSCLGRDSPLTVQTFASLGEQEVSFGAIAGHHDFLDVQVRDGRIQNDKHILRNENLMYKPYNQEVSLPDIISLQIEQNDAYL